MRIFLLHFRQHLYTSFLLPTPQVPNCCCNCTKTFMLGVHYVYSESDVQLMCTLLSSPLFFIPSGPPSVLTLSCVGISGDVSGVVNVTVNWTLSGGDSADFYLINITTNTSQTPYWGLQNITTASVTQHELTGFMAGYEYNITVRGVNCESQEGKDSEPLTINPQGWSLCSASYVMSCVI